MVNWKCSVLLVAYGRCSWRDAAQVTAKVDRHQRGAVKEAIGPHVDEHLVGAVRGHDEFQLVRFPLQHFHFLQGVLLRVECHTAVGIFSCKTRMKKTRFSANLKLIYGD